MKKRTKAVFGVLTCLAAMAAHQAHADQLADVKSSKKLVCGVLDVFEPFGYTDTSTRSVQGYDVDVCKAVAAELGVEAEIKPVSIEARIPSLQQKQMDILAAGLAYSPQRAEQVGFSDAYYVSPNIIAAKKSKNYGSVKDLAGKRISFVKGSISENYIKQSVPDASAVGYEDITTGFTALVQGKVEGFSTSEEVFNKLVTRLGSKASGYAVLQPPIGREVWGIGVRKDESGMLGAVNSALENLEKTGKMQAIFDKWLGADTSYKMTRSFKVEPIK